MLSEYEFSTVLDLGSGAGTHAGVFAKYGKVVTALDYGKSPYYEHRNPEIGTIVADFNVYDFGGATFDCVWASHVLEHQPNTNFFLRKIHSVAKEGGVVAITVPPLKHQIVGGHVSLWNGGLLLYHLVLAGFDCAAARVRRYGYNISVILTKRSINVPDLAFDRGDLTRLKSFLPSSLRYYSDENDRPFDGRYLVPQLVTGKSKRYPALVCFARGACHSRILSPQCPHLQRLINFMSCVV